MKHFRLISVLFPLALLCCTSCGVQSDIVSDTQLTESDFTGNPETTASVTAPPDAWAVNTGTSTPTATESVSEISDANLSESMPETTFPAANTVQAVFQGISDSSTIDKSNLAALTYRFHVNGQAQSYRLATGASQDYAIQNMLKKGYHYDIALDGDTITAVREIEAAQFDYTPPVSGTPGKQTLCNFLKLAMEPVGTALYVYGGGWNWEDTGASIHTRSIGISPDWVRFFRENDTSYTFRDYFPSSGINEYYYAGLDCSGYVGWTVYNVFHTQEGSEGYVGKATEMAKRFAGYGWGEWTQNVPIPDGTAGTAMLPGDIMSMNNHVWISLGTCADGSIVIAHSTRSNSYAGQPGGGVQIAAIGYSTKCEAYQLATKYTNTYFPDWRARYPVSLERPGRYLTVDTETAGRFRWNHETLADPDGIGTMSAADALKLIFGEA